jgi:hypothetical protein
VSILFRAFLSQFVASENPATDAQLRHAIAGLLAFVLVPGILLLLEVFPDFQSIVVRVHAHRASPSLIDDRLEWIVLMLTVYSMVTIGLVAVSAWDSLTFDRADALVLGPLPLRGRTIVVAKLAALGSLLLGASAMVNLVNGVIFAFETSDLLGGRALVAHLVGFWAATGGGAVVMFASIVAIRSLLALAATPRLAAVAGAILQGAFVVALLCCVAVTPFVGPTVHRPAAALSQAAADALPWTWFVGLFETIRQSPRAGWPEFHLLRDRAVAALVVSVSAALVSSVIAFRRQMRAALTPIARPGPIGSARMARALARFLVLHDGRAAAVSDFVLTTLARNRPQQGCVAMNVAVCVAWALVAVVRAPNNVWSALQPAPTLLALWCAVGLRAAFFVPAEERAAWTFQFHVPEEMASLLRGVRAATLAFVAPPAIALAATVAGWHAALVTALITIAIAEAVVLTIDFVPFTRPYAPGHAKLKTRWPLYAAGSALVGYVLPHASLWLLVAIVLVLHVRTRSAAARWTVDPHEGADEVLSTVTRLDLLGAGGV